jgi:nucleoside-diphosphate-sugar epimerase
VSDVIQGLILLADRADPGEVYNLGSGEEVSMRQLTEIIGSVTGRPAVVETISHITDDTYRLVSNIAKACAQGYSPKISLSEGIKQLAQELGENPSPPVGATIFRRGQRGEV